MLRGFYRFSIFAPALLATGRGPSFYLHPGRSPESQAKERQQRQDNEASHGGQLLYPCGSMRRVSAWSDRVTDICVQRAGCDGNKKAVRRRQALNAKIPPMPGGKGGMKFRCLGHIFRTHFKPILGTFGTFCIHNNILFHIFILQSLRLITGRSQVRPLQGPPDFSGTYCIAVSASSFGHIFLDTYSIGGKLSIACLFCLSKTYW